jgi:predicted RNA-binding Zn-ribbon protein involved in translation (DUF1610 family)
MNCPTCGHAVKVVGDTTQRYEPIGCGAREIERLTKVRDAADAYISEYDKEGEHGNILRWHTLHDALVEVDRG